MRITFLSAIVFSSALLLSRCSKSDAGNNPPENRVNSTPVISSIVPAEGSALIQDTINGQHFSAILADNAVAFNGIQATILKASTSQLIVTVPQNGTTGPVTVTVGGQTATGPTFRYLTPPNDSVMVTTVAGSGVFGRSDGTAHTATFGFVWDLAFDKSGELWIADGSFNSVRRLLNGTVNTLKGLNTVAGMSQMQSAVLGLALDANGLVHVTDEFSAPIRTLSLQGTVSNFVGNAYSGTSDGAGENAFFRQARTMVFDKAGNLFIVDVGNNKIRKVTPSGVVTTFAGNMGGVGGWVDGTGTAAYFTNPQGIAIDKDDNLYIADHGNNKIRKITPAAVVTTIAGNNTGNYQDGFGLSAGIGFPWGIAVDNRNGNIYVSQVSGHRIRKIRPDGYVSTVAGTGSAGSTDGPGMMASFKSPTALVFDSAGHLYVADGGNYKIRKITFK